MVTREHIAAALTILLFGTTAVMGLILLLDALVLFGRMSEAVLFWIGVYQ